LIKRKKAPKGGKRPDAKKKDGGMTPWDQAARWYDTLVGVRGTDFHKDIVMPGAFRMLELKKGARVLDLGCGQGVFSRYLSRRGMLVEGLDSSEELIRFAGDKSKSAIRFHVADAGDPKAGGNARFDAVVCLLALQNMESLEPVFKNVARWLKPGGRFVMVLTHPCFRIPRQTHWGWDAEKKLEFRRVDHYASELRIPILTPPMARSKVYTWTYHRPLASYVEALSSAGLCVDGLEEWASNKESLPGKRSRAENRARKEIPLFMAIRARLNPSAK
jgi:ubiquinone/menaquinone biosynthesis C-methylase UbiE